MSTLLQEVLQREDVAEIEVCKWKHTLHHVHGRIVGESGESGAICLMRDDVI